MNDLEYLKVYIESIVKQLSEKEDPFLKGYTEAHKDLIIKIEDMEARK